MKTALIVVVLVLVEVILATKGSKKEGNELSAQHQDMQTRVRIVRSSEVNRALTMQVKTDNNSDDDDDDDDDDSNKRENEESLRGSGEASGNDDDDDDDDEGQNKVQKVVCKRRCAPPMTFDQCANPRCAMKHSIVKELCYYLCKHQQVKCRETCEPE